MSTMIKRFTTFLTEIAVVVGVFAVGCAITGCTPALSTEPTALYACPSTPYVYIDQYGTVHTVPTIQHDSTCWQVR